MTQPPYDPTQPPPTPPAPPGGGTPEAGNAQGYVLPYAPWSTRVGGYLLDVVVLLPAYVLVLVGAALGAGSADPGETPSVAFAVSIVGYLLVLGLAVWNMVFRQGRSGYTVGKQVLGIRLIAERTGQPLGPGLTFVRLLAHTLDTLACYLGWLWPLWDRKRQTFADKLLSTVVVEQRRS